MLSKYFAIMLIHMLSKYFAIMLVHMSRLTLKAIKDVNVCLHLTR